MTIYLVPCGLSILNWMKSYNAQAPGKRYVDVDPAALEDLCDEVEQWQSGAEHDLESWKATVLEKALAANIGKWDPIVSAETSTLRARRPGGPLLTDDDRIVLMASETAEGISAALCVAAIIAVGNTHRIDGIADPEQKMRSGKVTVVRITGLKPTSLSLGRACEAMGTVLHNALASDESEKIEVHLTGGYKAALLHMLAMTELAYSRFPERVSAHYIFERVEGSRIRGDQAVRIGLRRFSQRQIEQMHDELMDARNGRPIWAPQTFEGYAWEPYGNGTRLTDFGRGYLAVLGGPHTPGTNDGGGL
jgi:CRISPR-associated protein (Cas_APE2256).